MSLFKFNRISYSLWLLVPLVFRLVSAPTANLSFFVLATYSMLGRSQAIQAIAMTWLLTMISPGIAPEASFASVGRYIVFLTAFISILSRSSFLDGGIRINRTVLNTLLIGVLLIIHSLLVSASPEVSILKVSSWAIVTVSLLSAWSGLSAEASHRLFSNLYLGLSAVMLVSIPLYFLPLGYLRNDSGFQGILNHPQAFGPAMAILATIACSKLLEEKKPPWLHVLIFGLALFFIISSEARTAGFAVVIGLLSSILFISLLSGKKVRALLPGLKSRRVWRLFALILVIGVIFSSQISTKIDQFISKSSRAGSELSITEAYDRSRGVLIDRMLENIYKNPFSGIGFGVASEPETMQIERDPLFGIPISASIEKGVMPLAILEEIGIPMAIVLFAWMFGLVRSAASKGIASLAVILTALLVNMGENVLFSPGGMGMLILIAVTWAASKPNIVRGDDFSGNN